MENDLTQKDREALTTLLDYGILTVSQLAVLCFPSRQMAREKARDLVKRGLTEMSYRCFGKPAGWPESVVALSARVLKILRDMGVAGPKVVVDYDCGTEY
jgi:hypothetical protein